MYLIFHPVLEFSLMLSLVLVQVFPEKVYAQENRSLFVPVDINKMTTRQAGSGGFQNRAVVEKKISAYRSQPTTLKVHLIKVNFDLLNSLNSNVADFTRQSFVNREPHFVLNPQNNKSVGFNKVFIQRDSQSEFLVEEENTGTMERIVLDVYPYEKIAFGQFVTASALYHIRPLEGDIHALIQVDNSKFKDVFVNLPNLKTPGKDKLKKTNTPQTCDQNAHNTIDIIAAYTSDVMVDFGAVKFIRHSVKMANNSFHRSGIKITINLKHHYPINIKIPETLHAQGILNSFVAEDSTHELRVKTKADIAVLFTGAGGNGRAVGAVPLENLYDFDKKHAFAWIRAYYSYTLAHEIGHILGAHHNKEAGGDNTRFPYGHGFASSNGHTLMAYSCNPFCPPKTIWSDPKNEGWGIPGESNNTKLFKETACIVAGYY